MVYIQVLIFFQVANCLYPGPYLYPSYIHTVHNQVLINIQDMVYIPVLTFVLVLVNFQVLVFIQVMVCIQVLMFILAQACFKILNLYSRS